MDLFGRLREPFSTSAARARNKAFCEAAMTVAAWVSAADRRVSLARRHTIDQVLETVDRLEGVETHKAIDLFDNRVGEFRANPERARTRAVKALSGVADDPETVELLTRIAVAVAHADGEASVAARTCADEIASILDISAPEEGASARKEDESAPGPTLGRRRPTPDQGSPTVIVLGNEKGGTGKSTTAMHLAVALAEASRRVGCIDLDARQGTLTRYITNRKAFAKTHDLKIAVPAFRQVERSEKRDRAAAAQEETARLDMALRDFADHEVVVIDTPGADSHLCRLGHARADILITPLNDSFLDIDVLARIDRVRREVLGPSPYSDMVQEQNERRVADGRNAIDWIVMRNRLAHIDTRNTREMARLLEQLSARMQFRLEPGFSERMVFRELFFLGLTLLDLPEDLKDIRVNASRRRARRELDDLIQALGLPKPAGKVEGTAVPGLHLA